jgi:hypothetical protein
MKFLAISQRKILGSSLLLPAYGREGQGQHLFYRRRFLRSKIRNSAVAKARAGRAFISPSPPFLPAPLERFGFCRAAGAASFGISFKKGSRFVQ